MKTIPVGKSGKVALVDDEDYERLGGHTWRLVGHGKYAARHAVVDGRRTSIQMHREIVGAPPGISVDHVNRDGLDNRRANLRLCTVSQNGHNRWISKNNSTGEKGVYFAANDRRRKKWKAYIGIGGRWVHVGRFATREEAVAARNAAEIKHFGEFSPQEIRS